MPKITHKNSPSVTSLNMVHRQRSSGPGANGAHIQPTAPLPNPAPMGPQPRETYSCSSVGSVRAGDTPKSWEWFVSIYVRGSGAQRKGS